MQSPLCHETRADGQSAPHARGKREWLPSRSSRGGRARGCDQPSSPRERLCTLPDHAGPSSAELAQEPLWIIAFFSAPLLGLRWSSAVGATGGQHFQCNPLYRVRKCHVPAPQDVFRPAFTRHVCLALQSVGSAHTPGNTAVQKKSAVLLASMRYIGNHYKWCPSAAHPSEDVKKRSESQNLCCTRMLYIGTVHGYVQYKSPEVDRNEHRCDPLLQS